MKLSQLSPEQKTRLLAELDGWLFPVGINPQWCSAVSPSGVKFNWWHPDEFEKFKKRSGLPSYLTSYDAIIPLVQKLDEENQRIVWDELCPQRVTLTTSQLCDAVLVATGKAEL